MQTALGPDLSLMRPAILSLLGLIVVSLLAVSASSHDAAAEAVLPPAGSIGFDVSYPQCGAKLPTKGDFAVVGVTGGLPFSANPCLASQFGWANSRGNAALYMNTANPAPRSSYYWPASGSSDPAICRDNNSVSDSGCAYDYGWHAAAAALEVAKKELGSTASAVAWWLDVETANSWNGTAAANAADLQGSIDYLRSQNIPVVGIYSTNYQWELITGGYSVASASSYLAAWNGAFVPQNPIGQSPAWVAGLSSLKRAQANCGSSFNGGQTVLAQYRTNGLDGDYACPTAASPSPNVVEDLLGSVVVLWN